MPWAAERLRLPVYADSQRRLVARWGFDINHPAAAERAERLLAEGPTNPDRLLLAAAVRSSRGDDDGAIKAAREAVATDDRSARAHTTLATLLARSGDDDGAIRHSNRAAELDPSDPVALYNRAVTAWTAGQRGAAKLDFDRVAALLGTPKPRWWRRGSGA